MLVKFNIDIDAVIADIEANPGVADIWLTDLWDFWQYHGIFCGGGLNGVLDKAVRLSDSTQSHKTAIRVLINALIDSNQELNRRIIDSEEIDFQEVSSCSDFGNFQTQTLLTLMGDAQIKGLKKEKGEDEEGLLCALFRYGNCPVAARWPCLSC